MNRPICFFIVLLMASTARAETYMDWNLAAHHWDRSRVRERNLSENNPGIGFETAFDNDDLRGMLGVYHNSNRKYSIYALIGYTPLRFGGLSVGVVGGALTGYNYAPVVPGAGLLASYQWGKSGINIIAVPTVEKYHIWGFAGLQARFLL